MTTLDLRPTVPLHPPDPAAVEALRAAPGLPAAARSAAAAIAELYRGHWLLNRLISDRGRFVLSLMILDLHFGGGRGAADGGLTTGRLKALTTEHGVCSPGRAGAMLASMRLFGLLAAAPSSDRRQHRLVPTERLIGMHRERLRRLFAAMAAVLPEGRRAEALIAREDFLAAHVHQMVGLYLSGLRIVEAVPATEVFAERDAGMMIAFAVLVASPPGEDGGAGVAVADLARRFAVSRAHVLSVLRDAEQAGLVRRTPGGGTTATPALVTAIEEFFATLFLLQASCVRAAEASLGLGEA